MNLVAADVRRLILFRLKEVGASSRRLLRFRGFNARRFSVATLHRILSRMTWRNISLALSLVMASGVFSAESDGVTPWRQDQPPNPPYSPQEALSKISVPEGFNVELVASEPDIVNPIAMAFDDRGRIWITESIEYPRKAAGPGRDRVKILEDTDFVETGYYERQAGAYPPFTIKLGSITDHSHQKTAYCGIAFLDTDAFPAQYRGRICVGNIHGGCINMDRLQRDGATYLAKAEPDLLSANDAWFMPVIWSWAKRFLLPSILAASGCVSDSARRDRPAIAEARAVQFLKREVPAWSRNNGCFSCHNNGDGARALYAAMRKGYRVPVRVLADTTDWVGQPDRWEQK